MLKACADWLQQAGMVLSRKLSTSVMHTHITMRSCRELEGILSDRHEDITNLHDQLATSHSRSVHAPDCVAPVIFPVKALSAQSSDPHGMHVSADKVICSLHL